MANSKYYKVEKHSFTNNEQHRTMSYYVVTEWVVNGCNGVQFLNNTYKVNPFSNQMFLNLEDAKEFIRFIGKATCVEETIYKENIGLSESIVCNKCELLGSCTKFADKDCLGFIPKGAFK